MPPGATGQQPNGLAAQLATQPGTPGAMPPGTAGLAAGGPQPLPASGVMPPQQHQQQGSQAQQPMGGHAGLPGSPAQPTAPGGPAGLAAQQVLFALFLASGCLLSLPSCASSWMIWFLRRAVPSSGNPAKQTETPGWLDWHPMRRPCHIASGTHHDIEIVPPAVAATPDATGSACVASAAAAGCSAA